MRLSDWRASAPNSDSLAPKVLATVEPVLAAMGAGADPSCWVVWGDDPGIRFMLLAPIDPGLIVCHVRVNVPGEGPRASAKLVRWSRVQLGELALETQAGHKVISFQVEGQVLRGADAEADRVGEFAMGLFSAADGRPLPKPAPARRARGTGTTPSIATRPAAPRKPSKT
jgi:hypothetical protein